MNANARRLFALWIAKNYPEAFDALAMRAGVVDVNLAGWGDVFSAIGTGITTAAKAIGSAGSQILSGVSNFVGTEAGQKAIGDIAGLYFTSQANKSALNVQLSALERGVAPAPITTQVEPVTGTTVPVYQASPSQPPQIVTPSLAQQLSANLSRVDPTMMIAAVAGGFLLLVMAMRRRH